MKRMGHVIGLKAEAIPEYKRLHADVWPQVLSTIAAANIRNYSIFLKEPENLMFAYWEYHGADFAADAAKMAADPVTRIGGRSAADADRPSRRGRMASGGHRWKRSSTRTRFIRECSKSYRALHLDTGFRRDDARAAKSVLKIAASATR